jgi:16S rRNA (guanine527-N7)-methyltransferase
LQVSLCESVGKKARAVAEIVAQLGLAVPVLHARAEALLGKGDAMFVVPPSGGIRPEHRLKAELRTAFSFDTLVIRAVARLRKLLEWFRPHWNSFGRMLVLKGPSWVEERGEARHYGLFHGLELRKLTAYPLPGTKAESVLLQIRRKPL